jgi:hypothetical protein
LTRAMLPAAETTISSRNSAAPAQLAPGTSTARSPGPETTRVLPAEVLSQWNWSGYEHGRHLMLALQP